MRRLPCPGRNGWCVGRRWWHFRVTWFEAWAVVIVLTLNAWSYGHNIELTTAQSIEYLLVLLGWFAVWMIVGNLLHNWVWTHDEGTDDAEQEAE